VSAYLSVTDGAQMKRALRTLLDDREMSSAMVQTGLRVISEKHTCRHRAQQLLDVVEGIRAQRQPQRNPDIGAIA
jgi:spore maturation protein CgeB